jgi:hypothetical protein
MQSISFPDHSKNDTSFASNTDRPQSAMMMQLLQASDLEESQSNRVHQSRPLTARPASTADDADKYA